MIVWSSCILFGLVEGLQHSLIVSGDPLDLIVLRKGSTNEINSGFSTEKADDLLTLGGIARDESGRPLAAAELLEHPGRRAARRHPDQHHHPGCLGRLAQAPARTSRSSRGGTSSPGKGECIVSRSLSRRFKGAALGGGPQGRREGERTGSSASSPPAAARPRARSGPTSRTCARNIGREGIVSCVQLRAASAGRPRPAQGDDRATTPSSSSTPRARPTTSPSRR